ncbi:hypothetical protein ACFOOK_26820 [Micromonospora krabiensis]|uniref:Uncharacterized protein n=1 Tax=Micromonospora krabiensis TaxID=307121 RepID=A0A1C3N5E8_9ACTN|nr:hypothetical protein [Micromonospora krabiensis]SBV27819.1 hypothetical protein GA0070620_3349 [Micromonospora krabiensis]
MSETPGLQIPAYFSYLKSPVKLVSAPDGGVHAWRLSRKTGGWESVDHLIDDIAFAVGGEVTRLTADRFVQLTEHDRARYLQGEGAIFALYETISAVESTAAEERRPLTIEERALIAGLRRRTFAMFEEQLREKGDPGADPGVL